jgi:MFS family permease
LCSNQSRALAALTLGKVITICEIILLSALQGLINALDTPARHAFLMQMVEDRSDLSNAIAINSTMTNGARLIGPAIAGLVIGAVGEGWDYVRSFRPIRTALLGGALVSIAFTFELPKVKSLMKSTYEEMGIL